MALRSLANGWSTSDRYHEAVRLPCLFGCNLVHPRFHERTIPKDIFDHYLEFPILWRIVRDICGECYYDKPHRLGVGSEGGIIGIVVAHLVYHHMKFTNRNILLRARSVSEWSWLVESAFKFGSVAYRDLF